MRHVPRESMASMPDMLFLLRRLSGALAEVAGRLEPLGRETTSRTRPRARMAFLGDQNAIAAGRLGKEPRRDQTRTVFSRRGKRVDVVERASRQMELTL